MRPEIGPLAFLMAVGCSGSAREENTSAPPLTTAGVNVGSSTGDAPGGESVTGDDERLDLGSPNTGGPAHCNEGEDCPDGCEEYVHAPCDDGTSDPGEALGLGCPGEALISVSADGSPDAIGVRTGFGATDTWAPREGGAFAVLGSGRVAELDLETPPSDSDAWPTYCNESLGALNPGAELPPPVRTNDVEGDCSADATFLGTGDCSSTIAGQFSQGGQANDYAELRIQATVPQGQNSLSYDFAFFSTEYPTFYGSSFNDMYVGWLESESWTGNISFDEQGNPISLNAGFLDFRDDDGTVHPEFDGTCMKQHAGTKWLSSTAPVTPGEDITLVLSIFDLSDAALDSYVFIDNFAWGCEGMETPTTTPVG